MRYAYYIVTFDMLLCIIAIITHNLIRFYNLYIGFTISSCCDPIMAALAGIKIEQNADEGIAAGALLMLAGHSSNQDLPGNRLLQFKQ